MNALVSTIHYRKTWFYSAAAGLVVFGILLFVSPVLGFDPQKAVLNIVSWLVMPVISFLGKILLIFIEILIKIFSFSEFVDSPTVQLGWAIVRDVANMAIVIALIIIAFATVFRIQKYTASQLLVRLVIAAILVNFSLLIAGLIIDFGNVIMMTFVHAFEKLAAGNLTVGLHIEDMLKVATSNANPDLSGGSMMSVLGAMLLAVVLLVVAIGVILAFIVVLLQRIIFLWILAIFSPVAWVGPLLPGGSGYASQWWSNFSKQVFIGPTLAFGFWLSMSVLAGLSANQHLIGLAVSNTSKEQLQAIGEGGSSQIARFVSEASSPQNMLDFMVTIALLLGTLWMAKSAGGAAAKFAGNVQGRFQRAGAAPFKKIGTLAEKGFKWGAKKAGVTGAVGLAAGGPLGLAAAMAARKAAAVGLRRLPARAPAGAGRFRRAVTAAGAPVGRFARDKYASTQRAKQRAMRARLEKIGIGDEFGEQLSRLPNIFPFRNIRTVGARISADHIASQRMANAFNDPTLANSSAAFTGLTASQVHTRAGGINARFRRTLPMMDNNAVAGLTQAIGIPVGAAGHMDNDMLQDLQRAIASFRQGGYTAPHLADIETALNAEASGRGLTSTVADYENTVVPAAFSKTNMDDLIKHNQQKQAFEEFKLKPENTGKSDEDLKKEFFRSEMARQAIKEGNKDTGRFVQEATKEGVGESQLRELGVQNLTVKAGRVQFEEPTEMPNAEAMQADYERMEQEMKRIEGATHEGVTVGNFGRKEGSNVIAAGLDEVNEKMQQMGLGHVTGFEDETSEGVRVQNVEPVRQGLLGMVEEQLNKLNGATSNAEKVEALKSFGIQTSENNENLDNLVQRSITKGEAAQKKLQNKDLVDQEGLILINKNRVAGSSRGIIRHEQAHDLIAQSDQSGEKREHLNSELTPEIRQRINEHVSKRSDAGQLSEEQKVEEYAADVMTDRFKDEEFRVMINESGLLNKKREPQKPLEIKTEEEEVKPEAKQAIKNSPEVQNSVDNIQSQIAQPGFLANTRQYFAMRKSLNDLTSQMSKLSKNLNISFGSLGKQIKSLNSTLPNVGATPLEIKAVTEEQNISEDKLKDLINQFGE